MMMAYKKSFDVANLNNTSFESYHSILFSLQSAAELPSISKVKHRKHCKSWPSEVTWKIKFKCEFCLFCLS